MFTGDLPATSGGQAEIIASGAEGNGGAQSFHDAFRVARLPRRLLALECPPARFFARYGVEVQNTITAVGRYCIALALLALPVGCMTTRPILSDGPVLLRENEGIVVLHVDTDTPIAAVSISGLRVLKNLPSGRHISLHVLTAGRYSFSTLMTGNNWINFRYPLYRLGDERLRFNVRPGEISYPGLLLVRRTSPGFGLSLHVRSFSRAGQALSTLRDEYPEILDRYPIVNGRVNRDDFLEFFQAEP